MGTSIRNLFGFRLIVPLLLSWGILASCSRDEASGSPAEGTVPVPVQIGDPLSRSFAPGQTPHVNRILVLPFRKSSEGAVNTDNANFVPAYNYGMQFDVSQFPLNNAVIHLPTGTTFKVLVIGYNVSDYNFATPNSPANRFGFGSANSPTTLANFHLAAKSGTVIPEFFTCLAVAYNGAVSQGNAFKAEQGFTLQGNLTRMVSGLSMTITGVPAHVKSISLRAENLVTSSLALDGTPTQWQTTNDGANRVLSKMIPTGGSAAVDLYLLPTLNGHKTGLFLDVEYGSTVETFTVKSPDQPGVVSGYKFIFMPNQATNLTGDYSQIGFGFKLCYGINLDDPQWDGYH